MLNSRAKEIQQLLCDKFPVETISQHSYRRELNDNVLKALPKSLANQYCVIEKMRAQIKELEGKLDDKWEKLREGINTISKEQEVVKNKAQDRLKEAVDNATIEIQFAESACDAHDILSSLPTISELLK